jgi:hypothetical protein
MAYKYGKEDAEFPEKSRSTALLYLDRSGGLLGLLWSSLRDCECADTGGILRECYVPASPAVRPKSGRVFACLWSL